MLPLTLATSFFGMNVETWHFSNEIIWVTLLLVTLIFVWLAYIFLKKKIL
jgi:Mg2+ and Co2+ transporter CorA